MSRSPRRRQNSNGSNGSVTIVNINSRSRIKQLSSGSANSGRNMDDFWNGIDEAEYQAQAKTTSIKVPSSRQRTKQTSSSSEVSARGVHDDLPSIDDAQQQQQQQRQFKNKGQEDVEPPASHCDKKRTSRSFWKFLSFRKGGDR